MFAGIIEELGYIKSIKKYNGGFLVNILANKILKDLNIGDSISVNGVCLTSIKVKKKLFTANIIDETLKISNLSDLSEGNAVNLERSLRYNSRISGHLIQGHIEDLAEIVDIVEIGSEEKRFTIKINNKLKKFCIYKGSISIDGISLTIAKIDKNRIELAIIPHTYNNTTLQYRKIGDFVNLETDMISKYIQKQISH